MGWRESKARNEEKRRNDLQAELDRIRARLNHYEHCESLQKRLRHYCDLKGTKYENIGSWLQVGLPSGARITIYSNPLCWLHPATKAPIYGHIERPCGRIWTLMYLLEPEARFLFNKIGEKIKEFEDNKEQ